MLLAFLPVAFIPLDAIDAHVTTIYVMTNVMQDYIKLIGSMSTWILRSPLGFSALESQKRT